jgi:hypothetical protein
MRTKTLLFRIRSSVARVPVAAVSIAMATIVVASIAALGGQAPVFAAPDRASPVTPPCAWAEFSVSTINEGGPDSAATYWLLPFTVQEGLRIVLDGRYPDSRYTSLQVYKSGGGLFSTNGVESALADYRIEPDPDSVNPWQRTARYAGPGGGAFTVTLQSDVAPGQVNTLPASTASAGAQTTRTASTPASVSPASSAQSVEFVRRAPSGSGFPNADSGYLTAVVTPPGNGDVLVIRGKAATASRGSHPSPWPAPGIDMQYWSLCNYLVTPQVPLVVNQLPGGGVDYGCRYDSQVALNWRGDYTFVVGTEAQRAAIDQIPGATFLPFSTAQPTTTSVLLLRNMLVNPGFAEAIQNVPENASAASAAAVMGPYYPRAAICPLTTLTSGGPAACLAGTR